MIINELINDFIRRYMLLGYYWQLFSYIIIFLLSAIMVPIAKRRRFSWGQCILVVFLFFYTTTVYIAAVLAREPAIGDLTKFSLFWSWRKAMQGSIYIRKLILENIIMLMPVGFLLPLIDKNVFTPVRTVFLGFMFSLVIEISQYLMKTGLFEIDDLIHNTTGTLIGYILAALLTKAIDSIKKTV